MLSGSSGKFTSVFKRRFKKLPGSSSPSEPLDEKPAWEKLETDEERLKSIVAFYAPKPKNRHDDTLSQANPFLRMSRIYMESGGAFEPLVSVGQCMKSLRSNQQSKAVEGEIAFWKHLLTSALVAHKTRAKGSLVRVKPFDFVQSAIDIVHSVSTIQQRENAMSSAVNLGYEYLDDVDWSTLTHWHSTTLPSPDRQTNLRHEVVSLADSTQTRDTREEYLNLDNASDQSSIIEEDQPLVHLSAKAKGKRPVRLPGPLTLVGPAGSDDDVNRIVPHLRLGDPRPDDTTTLYIHDMVCNAFPSFTWHIRSAFTNVSEQIGPRAGKATIEKKRSHLSHLAGPQSRVSCCIAPIKMWHARAILYILHVFDPCAGNFAKERPVGPGSPGPIPAAMTCASEA